jgi:hypothetical protein
MFTPRLKVHASSLIPSSTFDTNEEFYVENVYADDENSDCEEHYINYIDDNDVFLDENNTSIESFLINDMEKISLIDNKIVPYTPYIHFLAPVSQQSQHVQQSPPQLHVQLQHVQQPHLERPQQYFENGNCCVIQMEF